MPQAPILKTIDEMMKKLAENVRVNRESETAIREYTNAIRALAQVCEDEETRANILLALEDVSGNPGFMGAVRAVFRDHTRVALTPSEIRGMIVSEKLMDLSSYSNPLASIHTTLRRMKEKGEVTDEVNAMGDKAYRYVNQAMREAMARKKRAIYGE
jgi:hypothetical protein